MPETINFKQEIEKLINLQEIDSQVFDLKSQKESFPERIKEMDASLEGKKTGINAAEEDLKAVQLLKNEKEMDLKEKEEKIKKHEADLYQIKNNKEYQALQGEIDSIKADVSLIEEDILGLFDKVEEAQMKCAKEKKLFQEEEEKVEAEKRKIKLEEKELDVKIKELEEKRKTFIDQIDKVVLSKYETILKNRGRIAVALIAGECCSECNMHLRAQIINEAKMQKSMTFCENCARILYVRD